jgi:L-threonylcarbamoyladenylate synthase
MIMDVKTKYFTEKDEELILAAKFLEEGKTVIFPTETVYGLGTNALSVSSVEKIFLAKGRPSDNPLIIHISKPEDAEKYTFTNHIYYKLAEAFMPGPLTVILPKKDTIPFSVTGGLDSVAVRCPSHPIARKLIECAEIPIAAPSANLSGKPSPTCARHVIDDLNGRVDMIIDGGSCEIGLESTIIKLEGDIATLLRPGAITADALTCVCSHVEIAPAVLEQLKENERPLSPGMKYRHYAPKGRLTIVEGMPENRAAYINDRLRRCREEGIRTGVICTDETRDLYVADLVKSAGSRESEESVARELFRILREFDDEGAEEIYAESFDSSGIGRAVMNRLLKAAGQRIVHV